MTAEEREALRSKAEKATPGPYYGPRVTDHWPPGWVGIYACDGDGTPIPGDIVGVTGRYDEEQQQADAAYFGALAPERVLWLLNEVERLTGETDESE